MLARLKVNFITFAPAIDESRRADESPIQLVERLAIQKARAATQRYPNHLVIGSDQVAVVGQECLGKPASRAHAIQQLVMMSGGKIEILTGLALLNTAVGTVQSDVVNYRVTFRKLTRRLIENYVDADEPYDCGGSLRSEGLGILLLKEFDGPDPNALLGLPLIRLIDMLNQEGYSVL